MIKGKFSSLIVQAFMKINNIAPGFIDGILDFKTIRVAVVYQIASFRS